MKKDEVELMFEARCKMFLIFDPTRPEIKPWLKEARIILEPGPNLNRSLYVDKDDIPTADGAKAIIQCFIAGISAAITHAHQNGYRDESENLRHVINDLQRHFTAVKDADTTDY